MTPRSALGALHIGALMFGLTGVFGKLAAASPAIIVFGRAAFAVLALAVFARFASNAPWKKLELRDWRRLLVSGVLLAAHWVTFFIAVKVAGVAVALELDGDHRRQRCELREQAAGEADLDGHQPAVQKDERRHVGAQRAAMDLVVGVQASAGRMAAGRFHR